jgi:hypothetical protein
MNTHAKKPKSINWFEPSWSFRPRLKRDLACGLNLRRVVRIFAVALLVVIPLAFFVTRAVPNLQFNWAHALIRAVAGVGLSLAAFFAILWFIPPRIGINAKGIYRQQGNHAVWRQCPDIRRIILDRTVLERPRLRVDAAGKKEFDCGIASKINLDSLAASLRETFPNGIIEEIK